MSIATPIPVERRSGKGWQLARRRHRRIIAGGWGAGEADMPVREIARLIYKVGMIAITLTLIGLAYLAYRTATPGNQQLLIAGILGMLALITGLSITKLDDQDEQAATYRGMLDDLRKHVKFSMSTAQPGMPDAGPAAPEGMTSLGSTTISFAEPEVHHVDSSMLDTAKRMAADGMPIDDICRAVDRDHDRHDPIHQEAFRRVVKAMIEQA
jgi:hypothetical protein